MMDRVNPHRHNRQAFHETDQIAVTTAIDYETIDTRLKAIGLQITAAEAHGLVTGLICGDFDRSLALMNRELLTEKPADDREFHESKAELTQMHAIINEQLRDMELGFRLLLPAENAGIPGRAAALVNWCQGFMYGFGVSARESEKKLSPDAQEALQDLGEFTRLDTLAVSEDDEEEMEALTELEEYMRVAVITIHQDMLPR
jgi:yecA family protein